jgi:hypothetical protein
MNADYYFKEAAKKCISGDLPQAVLLVKKGLTLTPDHYNCRFTQGVIMFKLGLVCEAASDFYKLTLLNSHEASVYLNLAICLI